MKSSSDVRPAIILPLGNGSYHYNYNIVEEKVEQPPLHQGRRAADKQIQQELNQLAVRIINTK